jgi:hypothetical protein
VNARQRRTRRRLAARDPRRARAIAEHTGEVALVFGHDLRDFRTALEPIPGLSVDEVQRYADWLERAFSSAESRARYTDEQIRACVSRVDDE